MLRKERKKEKRGTLTYGIKFEVFLLCIYLQFQREQKKFTKINKTRFIW